MHAVTLKETHIPEERDKLCFNCWLAVAPKMEDGGQDIFPEITEPAARVLCRSRAVRGEREE